MRRSLIAALLLTATCSTAFASATYTSANAQVRTNLDASFFDNVTVSEVAASDRDSGYSLITFYKFFGTTGYGGPLNVDITNLQTGSAFTSASAYLSALRPVNAIWTNPPSASMYVESPANRAFVMTSSSVSVGLVNQPLLPQETQSFHIESIGISGQGRQTGSFLSVYPGLALTLSIRVSSVPELSSGTLGLMGALSMPLAVGWYRTRRQGRA